MNVYTLISACNLTSIEELCVKEKNIKDHVIIVNQNLNHKCNDKTYFDESNDIKMVTYTEKGISKSRNRLLTNSKNGIGIITDDDITFVPDYTTLIEKVYEENPTADIITFNIKIGDKIIGSDKQFKHNQISIFSICSCQISLKINSIKDKSISFDESFGIGSSFSSGEENIFLNDCLAKGLNIIHVPILLCEHPDENTTGEKWDVRLVKSKGAFSYRILKKFYFIIGIYFMFFKHSYYKKQLSIVEFIKFFIEGKNEYKNMKRGSND